MSKPMIDEKGAVRELTEENPDLPVSMINDILLAREEEPEEYSFE